VLGTGLDFLNPFFKIVLLSGVLGTGLDFLNPFSGFGGNPKNGFIKDRLLGGTTENNRQYGPARSARGEDD